MCSSRKDAGHAFWKMPMSSQPSGNNCPSFHSAIPPLGTLDAWLSLSAFLCAALTDCAPAYM